MASTNKTTNYELSQFEGTDKPSWEADYNADMLAIDTNLKAVSDIADGASGSISTLADRVTTAEGNITTNANDIDALEARADALEAGETAADGRLDALEAEQIVQNTAIESNTRLGYNLARPYDSASTYALNSYVLFQDTLYKCTTAVTTGEAFDPTKWLAIKATDEIAAGGYTLPTASASTLGGVKVGSGLDIDNGVLSTKGEYFYYNDYNETEKLFTLRSSSNYRYTVSNPTTSTAFNIGTPTSIKSYIQGYKIGDVTIVNGFIITDITSQNIPAGAYFFNLSMYFDFNPQSPLFSIFENMSNPIFILPKDSHRLWSTSNREYGNITFTNNEKYIEIDSLTPAFNIGQTTVTSIYSQFTIVFHNTTT